MKFKAVGITLVVFLIAILSFLALVAGVDEKGSGPQSAQQNNSGSSSSGSGRTSGRIGGLN